MALVISRNDKVKNSLCVAVDKYHSRFEFYSMENGDKNTVEHKHKEYSSKIYSAEFMAELTEAVRDYVSGIALIKDYSVTFLIPDELVAMDTVSIPNMNRRRNDEAIEATISGLFKNREELFINRCLSSQSKHTATYSLAIANKDLIKSFVTAFTDAGVTLNNVSFMTNATVNALTQLCPKIKNSSYLMLDIKHHYARFAFVCKGRTVGYYSLPFGYSILKKSKVFSEDMLFEHSVAELAVLNAKEKARAKQLTVMHKDAMEESGEMSPENNESFFGEDENATVDPTAGTTAVTIKTLPKKVPRKLPKFMLRPQPHTDEEYSYENFRIFMKWALTLIEANTKLTSQGMPESVYVNMPADLDFLFDMVNAEKDENCIMFQPLNLHGNHGDIPENLELFGGLYASVCNQNNNFTA